MTTILLGKECSPFLEIDDSLLQRVEVHLAWAETADAFVPIAREQRPDLVVLDPQVPGFDATATVRALLAPDGCPSALVFVIGNSSDHEQMQAAKDAGATGLITRPVTQARLLEVMRRHGLVAERDEDRVEVALKVDLVHGGEESLAYTRDLAVEGCFLHAPGPFAPGEKVRLTFQLPVPGGREVKVAGEVVRVEPASPGGSGNGGIAVHFAGLAAADRVELGRFLRSRRQGVA